MRTGRSCKGPLQVFVFAVAFAGFSPSQAQSTVWVDDCAGVGTGTEANPFCKIQRAICDIQATGGEIKVKPGAYHEAIRVTANTRIKPPDGPDVTTIDATGRPCTLPDFCGTATSGTCAAVYFPSTAG